MPLIWIIAIVTAICGPSLHLSRFTVVKFDMQRVSEEKNANAIA
jgi:hypothetical protein